MNTLIPLAPIAALLALLGAAAGSDLAAKDDARPRAAVAAAVDNRESDPIVIGVPQPKLSGQAAYKLGQRITITADWTAPAAAQSKLVWELKGAASEDTVETDVGDDGRTLSVWTTEPGSFVATVQGEYAMRVLVPGPRFPQEPTDVQEAMFPGATQVVAHSFTVGGSPQPKPQPPGPQPPPVVPDVPAPGTLAALVPDAGARALLSELFADFADAAARGEYANAEHFRNSYRDVIAKAQESGQLPTGISAIDKPISDRIAAVTGLVPTAAVDGQKLAEALRQVSAEFTR